MNRIPLFRCKARRRARAAAAWSAAFLATTACTALAEQELNPDLKFAVPEAEEESEVYNQWIELGIGSLLDFDGSRPTYQQQLGLPKGDVYGGVESLHLEKELGNALINFDGRAIIDNNDYKAELTIDLPDVAYLNVGYRDFRTWYDSNGGFFPPNQKWFNLYPDAWALDRGEAWFELGLRIPDWPEITFGYSHRFRQGRKDSTIWGDSRLTGPAMEDRRFVPTFLDIDEVRDAFTLDVKHTIGNTDAGLGARYERIEIDNSRDIRRRPDEPTADRKVTQRDETDSDLFNTHAFTETRFGEKAMLTTAYSYTSLNSNISGSRIYGQTFDAAYDPLFVNRQPFDEGFFNLRGGSELDQHVANLNLWFNPWKDLVLVPSARIEQRNIEGTSQFVETNVGVGSGVPAETEPLAARSTRESVRVSERLEVRYTGINNVVLYARGEWMQEQGDLWEREFDPTLNLTDLLRDTNTDTFSQKYLIGANWYALRRLSLAAQYYHKKSDYDYDHALDSTLNGLSSENAYPAFIDNQNFNTDDVNFRVTWRPLGNLTLVGRYDYRLSTIDTKGDGLVGVESGNNTTQIISGSMTWSPFSRVWVQGNAHYVLSETETPFTAPPGSNLVTDAKNNYWTVSGGFGIAITDRTDLAANYTYYRADNFINNSTYSMPYGADGDDHAVTVTLTQQLNPQLRWSMKYGYYSSSDGTFGGRNNFDAHLLYSSLQFRF